MKRIPEWAVFVAFLGVVALLPLIVEANDDDRGKALYQDKCGFCHGQRGDGKGPAAEPLAGHPVSFANSGFWKGDAEMKIEETIKKGKEMMPAFDLETDEIKAIIRYMSEVFKKGTRNTQ